jgi:diacylglycerol kinase
MKNIFLPAINGFKTALKTELNLKIHCFAVLVVLAAGFLFHILITEWIALVLCFIIVISAELLNTSIEKLCDFITPERHPSIGKVKDIAAAAVLVAAMGSVVVGSMILGPYLIRYFTSL